nr:MAG TPA: hypothetical protein [Caudoviricetes sp.]
MTTPAFWPVVVFSYLFAVSRWWAVNRTGGGKSWFLTHGKKGS